jgi:DNA-binding IclR family transcriptional regulator
VDKRARGATPGIQSVERAAQLLSIFSVEEPELTLHDLVARTGVSRATVHRYALALRQAGLMRSGPDGAYGLGPRLIQLAAVALAGFGVVKAAGPYLDDLATHAGHTAVLSVWDGQAPVVVRVAETTRRPVRVTVAIGTRLPPHSAQGIVFRAFRPAGGGQRRLAAARRGGFAGDASVVPGVAAIACPVFEGAEIAATLALVGTQELLATGAETRPLRLLRDAAAALSREMGHLPAERSQLESR